MKESTDISFLLGHPILGGLWDAGAKRIKYHLKRVVGNINLTYEELMTVLTQIASIVNSNPLSYIIRP